MDASQLQIMHNRVREEVVTTQEQLLHAFLIRSICFMEGEGLKTKQAIDGNDFQATHFVFYDLEEPIGRVLQFARGLGGDFKTTYIQPFVGGLLNFEDFYLQSFTSLARSCCRVRLSCTKPFTTISQSWPILSNMVLPAAV